jgi:hypothetical protein
MWVMLRPKGRAPFDLSNTPARRLEFNSWN